MDYENKLYLHFPKGKLHTWGRKVSMGFLSMLCLSDDVVLVSS